jgi:hypothetical protein
MIPAFFFGFSNRFFIVAVETGTGTSNQKKKIFSGKSIRCVLNFDPLLVFNVALNEKGS